LLLGIKIGCQLPQETVDFEQLAEIAQECERLGYDSVWAYDHLSPFWTKHGHALECWTLLAAIAQSTNRIKLGSLVTNVNLRNPALLAKMTSTLDNISQGRIIIGLGTGDRMSQDELQSYGYNFPGLDERLGRLRETILILKSMWTDPETSFKGKYYSLSNAINSPKPVQKPRPPIWVGGKHRKILDVVAEMADGWNYWGLEQRILAQRTQYLQAKCEQLGRRPEEITKSWAGALHDLFQTGDARSMIFDKVKAELKNQASYGTKYLIASFGPRAELWWYKVFAEAARSLN